MAIDFSNSLEMPLLDSAFSSVLPHVICGQPIGRECATKLVSSCRGARLLGIRATWPAQRRIRLPIAVVAADVKKIQTTKKARGSDLVAKGMIVVRAKY